MSNGMRSVIVSIAEIVLSTFSSFKAGIPENVELHRFPGSTASRFVVPGPCSASLDCRQENFSSSLSHSSCQFLLYLMKKPNIASVGSGSRTVART